MRESLPDNQTEADSDSDGNGSRTQSHMILRDEEGTIYPVTYSNILSINNQRKIVLPHPCWQIPVTHKQPN